MDQSSSSQAEATKNAGLPKQTELMHTGSSSNKTTSLSSGSGQDDATGNQGPRRMPRDLHDAAEAGNVKVVRKYAEHLDLQLTPNKNTVLHVHIAVELSESSKPTTFVEEILDMCPSLLRQANTKGDTPLHVAARYGHSDIVKVLIERTNVLHELESGAGKAVEMLRMTNNEKDTALHKAVRYGHTEVVSLLTKEDPDFSYSTNNAYETPLYLAVERGFHGVVDVILENCTSPAYYGPYGRTALHAAAICNDQDMANKLLGRKRTLVKETDPDGRTPLHYAAHLGRTSIVRLLLAYDESAAYLADKDGKTALHIAASGGHSDIMKELISQCPDCCELVDSLGRNALHYAAVTIDNQAMECILKYSSVIRIINEKDADGNTPLHLYYASDRQYVHIIERHPGVDRMALNNQNKTPQDMSTSERKVTKIQEGLDERDLHERTAGRRRKIKFKALEVLERSRDRGCRKVDFKDVSYNERKVKEKEAKDKAALSELEKASQINLIVATLIATVTFAAAFTMPGGYIGHDGPVPGSPILIRKAAFKAFVITDTIAMALSASAVFIQYVSTTLIIANELSPNGIRLAIYLTYYAMLAMVVAFMTGIYAMLAHSSGLAIATCVIIACCFYFPISYIFPSLWKDNKNIFSATRREALRWYHTSYF